MTHRFPLPTDSEVENLITQVYEGMLNPEQSRLSLIENKLLRETRKNKSQKNLNKIPWWIVLLLAGGFTSAVWWAGDLFNNEQNTDNKAFSSDRISERKNDSNDVESNSENERQEREVYEDRGSPVIYQRESF